MQCARHFIYVNRQAGNEERLRFLFFILPFTGWLGVFPIIVK